MVRDLCYRASRLTVQPASDAVSAFVALAILASAASAGATVADLAQDVKFGTPEVRGEALKQLAATNTAESSEVLGRYMMSLIKEDTGAEVMELILKELRKAPHTKYCPELIEPLCNLVGVYNPPGRAPWKREKPYAEYSRPKWFPPDYEIAELIIYMRGDEVDDLIVSLATESYAFLGGTRNYIGMKNDIGAGDHRDYLTRKIIEAIPRICSKDRADKLMLGIVGGFYSFKDIHPMDAAVYYLGEHQVEGGREILESILKDYDSLELRKVPSGNSGAAPWALLLSDDGHWLTATGWAYTWPPSEQSQRGVRERQCDVFGAMIPILWALVEYESPMVRSYASAFKGTNHAGDEDLALVLCAVGDMTYRSVVHGVLRGKSADLRKLAAKCMFRCGSLNDEDRAILNYVARQDPDPEVKRYVSERLAEMVPPAPGR